MKKTTTFVLAIAIMSFLLFSFSGCNNQQSDGTKEDSSGFDYDMILRMPKTYLGTEDDCVGFDSLSHYTSEVFSDQNSKGALASFECLDTTFYITISHMDDKPVLSGKAVVRCKVVSVGEVFNNFSIAVGSVFETTQDYFLLPEAGESTVALLESLGGVCQKDENGNIINWEIADGDFLLERKENTTYELKIYHGTLPLENGKTYTGAICSYSSGSNFYIDYVAPMENAQRYEGFLMSESESLIAAQIKDQLTK